MKSEVLEGTMRKEDALEIKVWLAEEKQNGHRFVSFQADLDNLTREDFNVFKSAFAAREHAHEHSTDHDRYIIRSITVVEKEIDALLAPKKEQQQEQFNGREEKRSRDQELLR